MMTNSNIRLSEFYLSKIKEGFRKHFLSDDHLWIFGSRVYPEKRGGDIDLFIETDLENYTKAANCKMKFWSELQDNLGEQKIDIVLKLKSEKNDLPIYFVAKSEGVRII